MEYKGTKILRKWGGSYGLVIPREWVVANNLDLDRPEVTVSVRDDSMTIYITGKNRVSATGLQQDSTQG